MSPALRRDAGELPVTDDAPLPAQALLRTGRPAFATAIRLLWDLEIHGREHVPVAGPVVMAANHVGWLDGPLLAICSPRPVHALTKVEMFTGPMGPFLTAAGQIPLDRSAVDLGAVRTAVRTLRAGRAVGVFPEGRRGSGEMTSPRSGAAYLALVTGAPVVPVSFLGTRTPGGADGSLPPRGARIAMTYGEPVHLAPQPWPRTQRDVADAASRVTDAILATMQVAEATTGMSLPGPLGPRPEKKRR